MKSHQKSYAILNLLFDISTKTSKYIKQPHKLSDTDHAPNVADITNRLVQLLTKEDEGKELYSGIHLITVHGNISNASFQDFISLIKIEDLYLQRPSNETANATDFSQISTSNTTAGRQLLNSIEKEHSNIHSLLETENTNAVSVLQILIELFKQVDIILLKLDIQYKMHNILDIVDKKYIQESTLLPVKKKFQFYYWFAFHSNINYIPLWMKNFQSFMNEAHSYAFKDCKSDVNNIKSDYEQSRELSFKKFIEQIKNEPVFTFKPVGPFMEKKRPFESSPKNQNQYQDKRRNFDVSSKRNNVAHKRTACSMCKEK